MKRLLLFTSIIIIVLMFSCCSVPDDYKSTELSLTEENEDLKSTNKTLQLQIESLKDKIDNFDNSPSKYNTGEYIVYIIDTLMNTDAEITVFPATIKSVSYEDENRKEFCIIKIDRLEYNPNFELGSAGDESYLINEHEIDESIKVSSNTIVNYNMLSVPEINLEVIEYINQGGTQPKQFAFYCIDNQVFLVNELQVP